MEKFGSVASVVGGWGVGGHESGVRSSWDPPEASPGCVVSPRCVEEKVSLLKVSGQAHTTGGVLFVVALKELKAWISRDLHLINICAFEVQMVPKDGRKAQYRPHSIANGLGIGKDPAHTCF